MRTVEIDGCEWRVLCQEFDYGAKRGVSIDTERNGKKFRYAVRAPEYPSEEEAIEAALPALARWVSGKPRCG